MFFRESKGSRWRSAMAAAGALVLASASAAWAAPGDPVVVKDDPAVVEGAATSHGAWFGWNETRPGRLAPNGFFVQRRGQSPIKVNATRTEGLGGGVVGRHVYYVQRSGDRSRLFHFDLVTRDRSPLPAKVNHRRHSEHLACCDGPGERTRLVSGVRGDATVSGRWLLYSGYAAIPREDQRFLDTVMLYDRVDGRLRTVVAWRGDAGAAWAGQVNGRYATYSWAGRDGESELFRYDIETRRSVELPLPDEKVWDPGVSSDGTVYYLHRLADGAADDPADGPYRYELVRQPIGAPAEAVTTLTTDARASAPEQVFVRDRADGTRVVFFSWEDGIYKLVDGSGAPGAR